MAKEKKDKRKKKARKVRRRRSSAAVAVAENRRATRAKKALVDKPKKRRKISKRKTSKTVPQIEGVKTMVKAKKTRKGRNPFKKIQKSRKRSAGGSGMKKTLITGALMGGGAIAAALLSNKLLPQTMDKRLRAVLPFAVGLAIHSFVKNDMAHNMAYGMMALGTLFLAREFVPQIGLSGDEITVPQLPGTYQALIGENEFSGADEFMGLPDEFGEDLEVMGVPESFGEEGQETDWRRKD